MMPVPLSSDGAPTATSDDVLDILSGDDKDVDLTDKGDDVEVDKEPKKEKAKDKDETDEEDEIKLKTDKDEEDKIDLEDEDIEINAPPRKKEVTAKYPKFFQEFPWFEKMMFRDKQYTELFGSFDDAKVAAEEAGALHSFESDLLQGNSEKILTAVKDNDSKAWTKLVDNYLPTLAKVDKEAYLHITSNIARHIIRNMALTARENNNEDLRKSALLLNQFLFGTDKYTAPSNLSQEDDKTNEVEEERKAFTRERFETANNELQTKVDNILKATISDYIDPKGEMSSYVKRNAVRDALVMLHSTIDQDSNFKKQLDRLWEGAFGNNFNQRSLDSIRSAYLGKSKQLLKVVIKKARAEALKDSPRRVNDDDEVEETPRKRNPSPGRPRQSNQSGNKNQMQRGESVLEFLSRE